MLLILDIKVVTQSKQTAITVDKTGQTIVRVKSAPEKGRANVEVIKKLAEALQIPQSNITIIAGNRSKNKKVKLNILLTLPEVLHKLKGNG